jgi:hypothetical protein
MLFNNKFYDRLKWVAQIGLPALGTLYTAVAALWGGWMLTNSTNAVGTIVAVDTFLGVVLSISKKNYTPPTDGQLIVDKTQPKDIYGLDLTTHPDDLGAKSHIVLGVKDVNENKPAMPA